MVKDGQEVVKGGQEVVKTRQEVVKGGQEVKKWFVAIIFIHSFIHSLHLFHYFSLSN